MHSSPCLRPERRGLRPASRTIVRAIAEALLSDADPHGRPTPPNAAWLDQVVDDFDKTVGAGSTDIRRGLNVLALVIDRLPAVVIGSLTRMSRLPLIDRIAFLEAMENSRIGLMATLLIAFKIPLTMMAYDDGDPLFLTGFDRATAGTLRGEVAVPKPKGSLLVRLVPGASS
jgi:hypothetical protein